MLLCRRVRLPASRASVESTSVCARSGLGDVLVTLRQRPPRHERSCSGSGPRPSAPRSHVSGVVSVPHWNGSRVPRCCDCAATGVPLRALSFLGSFPGESARCVRWHFAPGAATLLCEVWAPLRLCSFSSLSGPGLRAGRVRSHRRRGPGRIM